ncbi:MAG TPA: amino acid adenylation domain-containing protein [Thermoanaerobaculia bacterium]|nr:amino acid adenylation domain-containing protein [Thermoanaerobaculia bacterium]
MSDSMEITSRLRGLSAEKREMLLRRIKPGGSAPAAPRIVPKPDERHQPFPLTDIQQAYWIGRTAFADSGNVACHAYAEFSSPGVDADRLTAAWRRLVARHDMLRAVIRPDGLQQILSEVPPYVVVRDDLRELDPDARQERLAATRERMSHQVHPTERWPLFELRLSRLPDAEILHVSFDLLIGDGWSRSILMSELFQLYRDPQLVLPQLDLSFRDYVLAELELTNSEEHERALAAWRERLADLPSAPELPLAVNPASITSPRFVRRRFRLEGAEWQRFRERAQAARLTPSGVLLTAYATVLAVWSSNRRFTLNLTLFNRQPLHPQVYDIVGDFTTLLLVAADAHDGTFTARAAALQEQLWEGMQRRHVSGVRVMRELARMRGTSRVSMPIVFTSLVAPGGSSHTATNGNEEYGVTQTPQVWIDHQVSESGGGLSLTWDSVDALFPTGLPDDMFAAYRTFVQRLAVDDEAWHEPWGVTAASMLSREHRARIETVNATPGPVPDGRLHDAFFERAAREPERVAVIGAARTLTYGELAAYANAVTRQLPERRELVAVIMEKGWEQVAAVLGILQSGAAYLPIDAGLPDERIASLLAAANVRVAFTQSKFASRFPGAIAVDTLAPAASAPRVVVDPEALAYVIYTSGSTGMPKGVMISHRAALNTVVDVNQRFAVTADDRVLALSSLNFDLSVWDIFGLLAAGGALVLPDPERGADPSHWGELLEAHRVTIWNSVPAMLDMYVSYVGRASARLPRGGRAEARPTLRLAMLSGDYIPVTLPSRIRALDESIEIISMGGATEASIWSILYPIGDVDPSWKSIPYGKPMRNQTFFVLNEALEPCPLWVTGELYIGGIGVADGYYGDEVRTRERFLEYRGQRLYRTGDLGRWLPDGNIEFLGRADFQVKVQGHRVELGEIEATLEQCPGVAAAVVTAFGDTNKRLAAYVVPERTPAFEPDLGEVIVGPAEREAFSRRRLSLRSVDDAPVLPRGDVSVLASRRSVRHFANTPVSLDALGALLDTCAEHDGRFAYPSASALHPVQTYVAVRNVAGLAPGLYYHHPVEHRLQLLAPGDLAGRALHFTTNQRMAGESAFTLFLVGALEAIEPMYGKLARDFCLIEAGAMLQLLSMEAPRHNLGLCAVGTLDFDAVRPHLGLGNQHLFLHAIAGGIPGESLSPADALRDTLRRKLPEYMVPSVIRFLPSLPLTSNGKVDRRALPPPDAGDDGAVQEPPRTPAEAVVASLFRELLSLRHIGRGDDFFLAGGNSFLALRLFTRLRDEHGLAIPLRDFFQLEPTVASIAQALQRRAGFSPPPDYAARAVLDPSIVLSTPYAYAPPRNIFLTGATGFVGAFLLRELLDRTEARVHCLVRPRDGATFARVQRNLAEHGLWRDADSARITAIAGDLAQPRFGLPPGEFRALASRIDTIHHCGAHVNFIVPYASLDPANAGGTTEVLRLAVEGTTKAVHHISTLALFPSTASDITAADFPHTPAPGGYAASKWVAEQLARTAVERGIPVTVYRLGLVSGDSRTGVWDDDNVVQRIIRGCLALGAAPDLDTIAFFSPVDYIASAVAALSLQPDSAGATYQLCNPRPVPMQAVFEHARALGFRVERVSVAEWRARLLAALAEDPESNALYPLLPLLAASGSEMSMPELYSATAMPRFDCSAAARALRGTAITCPPIDAALVATYLHELERRGLVTREPNA